MISVSPTADGSRHLCVQGYQQNVLYLPKKCLCYCSAYVVYRASLDSPKPQNNRHKLTKLWTSNSCVLQGKITVFAKEVRRL